MASQAIWIGITVGVFFVGIAGGYAVFQSTDSNFPLESDLKSMQDNQEIQEMSIAITEKELMNQLSDESVLLLDIREIQQFDQGHIEGAATATCAEDKREKVLARIPKSVKILLVDQDGAQAPEMVQLILDAGLDAQYLEGGMNNWQGELVQDPGAIQITPDELWNRIQQNDNLFLLDVRTPQEFMEYHIPNSVNVPLEYTFDAETVSMLPDDKDIIVICKSGTRATVSSFALAKQGIAGEILDGGIVAWLEYLDSKNLK